MTERAETPEQAALDALAFLESDGTDTTDRHLNMEAIYAHEAFLQGAEKPQLCPFCSVAWDQAEAERLVEAQDVEGYRAWHEATLALPVNAQGDDYGQRARTDADS